MSAWYWRVIALKAAIIFYFSNYVRADDNIQKLPFCNPGSSAANDLVLVSTLDGMLTAFSTQNGYKAWDIKTRPLLSSNLHHVELTAGGKWVRLVPSLRGTLYSLSGESIEPLPFDADQLLSSSFKYSDDLVIAGGRESAWVGVDVRTGEVVYECGSGGCSAEQQAGGGGAGGGDVLVLRTHSNTVRALDPRTGGEKWNFSVAEHQLALNRRGCGAVGGGIEEAEGEGRVWVLLPEGVVGVTRGEERAPLWQQQLGAPVSNVWRVRGGVLRRVDVVWEGARSELAAPPRPAPTAPTAPPALYIGVHDRQLYIQESLFYVQKIETAVSTKPVPWKVLKSRPLLEGGETALQLQAPDANTLSLITLYGNTGQQGNHGFFLYLEETCEQEVGGGGALEGGGALQVEGGARGGGGADGSSSQRLDVHVHVSSLWFWWKEVLLIAISSALLMNLMIWPRFFAPKIRPSSPLPINQEYIVVERHYDAPPPKTEYSGRYENDFTPLRCLGKGGFGVVFEARNNIDHCSYAVKRITLPNRKSRRERVLREVRALAKLEHSNIVRYFNAWVEEPPPLWQALRDEHTARNLEGASVLLSDECTSPAGERAGARGGGGDRMGARGDSVLLDMYSPPPPHLAPPTASPTPPSSPADQPKRHRSLSCNDSWSLPSGAPSGSQPSGSPSGSQPSQDWTRAAEPSSASPPNTLSRPPPSARLDESSSIVFEPGGDESKAQGDYSEGFDKKVAGGQISASYGDSHTSKGKKKKGHTRHWSLDACVRAGGGGGGGSEGRGRGASADMYLYIQMQLCCRHNLHDWLLHNHTWQARGGKEQVLSLFSQIVSAVEYVHCAGLIHRDLKPSNILFAPDGRVKVGDFGLVTTMRDDSDDSAPSDLPARHMHTHRVGTELYMSPEQRLGHTYGFEVDIYSLGLILLELYHPCATDTERIVCLNNARRGEYPPAFRGTHPQVMEVVSLMLSTDPARRPTARALRSLAPLAPAPSPSPSPVPA